MLRAEITTLHEDAFDFGLLGFAEEELGRLFDGLDADADNLGAADAEPSPDTATETHRGTLIERFCCPALERPGNVLSRGKFDRHSQGVFGGQ
jgi:hypothetical protein